MSQKPDKFSRRDFLRGKILNRFVDVSTRNLQATGEKIAEVATQLAASEAVRAGGSQTAGTSGASGGFGASGGGDFPVIRAPGAIEESQFLSQCTRCGDCLTACPHQALVLAPPAFRQAAGSPIINASVQPCLMCEDFPCIATCPGGALQPIEQGTGLGYKIADARILDYNCLNGSGRAAEQCSICVEQCPEVGAIVVDNNMPRVVEDKCTGCGICHYACPAPTNAIAMMPLPQRPVTLTVGNA